MHRRPTTTAFAILGASLILSCTLIPNTSADYALPTVAEIVGTVDGTRIMETISDLQSFGTRAFYLNQSEEAAAYIHERFVALSLQTEYQEFMAGIHPSSNVVATQPGISDPSRQFLFGAHYDSENRGAASLAEGQTLLAPGADDDASGVAVAIEIATVLSGLDLEYTVKYVAFGAEELGYDSSGALEGSGHYVSVEKSRNATYESAAILDMVGYRGDDPNHATIVVNRAGDDLANSTLEFTTANDLNLSVSVITAPTISYSDHFSFWLAGYPSMLVCEAGPDSGLDYEFNPTYHTEDDTIDYLSQEQMTELTKALIGGMLALNGLESDDEEDWTLALLVLGAVLAAAAVVIILYMKKVRR